MTTNSLPPYDKVFFVHYQCQNFNEGEQIYNMCVFHNNKIKQFDNNEPSEAAMIEAYCALVTKCCNEGLIPIHWKQNAKYFGTEHVCSRYKALTGKEIRLEYPNEIDLSSLLIEILGDDYVPHPRLDSLASLNDIRGHSSDYGTRMYPTQRIQLFTKIYHKLLNNKLKIGNPAPVETKKPVLESTPTMPAVANSQKKPAKSFYDFLLHTDKMALAAALKKEFTSEKGKTNRILLESMKSMDPPMLAWCNGEGKMLYNAMQQFFCHDIGSYNSIFESKIQANIYPADVEAMKVRLRFILEQIK